jgi:hypothetical protein
MSTAQKPTVLDALSGVSGIPRPEILEIAKKVRENHQRLDACAGPHDFEDITPEKIVGKTFRCRLCRGELCSTDCGWYQRGLAHGRAVADLERQARERLAQHRGNLALWKEPDGALVPTEPDPEEREKIRVELRAVIAELERILGEGASAR